MGASVGEKFTSAESWDRYGHCYFVEFPSEVCFHRNNIPNSCGLFFFFLVRQVRA